jgi:hypothetical protein
MERLTAWTGISPAVTNRLDRAAAVEAQAMSFCLARPTAQDSFATLQNSRLNGERVVVITVVPSFFIGPVLPHREPRKKAVAMSAVAWKREMFPAKLSRFGDQGFA